MISLSPDILDEVSQAVVKLYLLITWVRNSGLMQDYRIFEDMHHGITKLIEFNENQDTPLYLPSHLEGLKQKSDFFKVPDLDTKIQRHNNPHYWLEQDILQKNLSIQTLLPYYT